MFDYFTHQVDENNVKLVMTILVKNEVDVIESNIKTHANLGVDAFVIMDNGSNDGTREKLDELSKQFDMIIVDEPGKMIQKKFMTKLAFLAKKKYNPDWIINNDADEFWIPNKGTNLKEIVSFKGGILQVPRSNMLPPVKSLDDTSIWKKSISEVRNQVNYRSSFDNEASILLGQASRKVMTNPHGLIKINTGNHSAEHIAVWNKFETDKLHIYHYPVRSYEQFYNRVKTRKELLDKFPDIRLGNHEKRWKKIFEEGKLKEEYERFIYNNAELEVLKKSGIVFENKIPSSIIV